MITEQDYINDIELKLIRGMVSTDDLRTILSGGVSTNSTAKYCLELIQHGNITKDGLSNLVSKHIALEENETARLIKMTEGF
jgi:hypothetical protein